MGQIWINNTVKSPNRTIYSIIHIPENITFDTTPNQNKQQLYLNNGMFIVKRHKVKTLKAGSQSEPPSLLNDNGRHDTKAPHVLDTGTVIVLKHFEFCHWGSWLTPAKRVWLKRVQPHFKLAIQIHMYIHNKLLWCL